MVPAICVQVFCMEPLGGAGFQPALAAKMPAPHQGASVSKAILCPQDGLAPSAKKYGRTPSTLPCFGITKNAGDGGHGVKARKSIGIG